jgi:hypothetical protein
MNNRVHKALFHLIIDNAQGTKRTAQAMLDEMAYLKDAIELAWKLQAYDSMCVLTSYLLSVRKEYKELSGGGLIVT